MSSVLLSQSLEALCQIKIYFPHVKTDLLLWWQNSFDMIPKLFSWKISVLKHQSHFAEKCNFALSPPSLLLLKICAFFNINTARTFSHNNNDFASQNNFMGKKRHRKWQSFFFIFHVQGKRVKEEENICQITALMTASVRMECKVCTWHRIPGWMGLEIPCSQPIPTCSTRALRYLHSFSRQPLPRLCYTPNKGIFPHFQQ